ncbi:MAG: amidase [Bacteroidales bacterium]|jgi:amidase
MKQLHGNKFVLLSFLVLIISCTTRTDKKVLAPFPATYLEEMTIAKLEEGYSKGTYTVKQIVKDYLSRIEAIDKRGPALNSVIFLNPDAMQIADDLDKILASGKRRGPLFGVPVMLKDNIDTHDRMPNTAGSRALKDSYPLKDSPVARKLREAGAVIIGKTNLSEWANFRSSSSSSGWSGIGGQTKNPFVLDRNPCGSSAGSGAAVSANLCMIAIGTETDGSIVCPSNNNGIVGLKPTVGLLSRSGIIPISFTQDTPGPMGRTVSDVAACLGPLTGIDSADIKTLASSGRSKNDYTVFLNRNGLKGKRIGLLKNELGFSAGVDTIIMKVVETLKKEGAEVIAVETPKSNIGEDSYNVLLYEFRDGINKYLGSLADNAPVKNLKELIEFDKKDSVEMKYFDQKIFERADAKGGLDSKEYLEALKKILRATRDNGIDKLMNENRLDALIAPTGSPAWKTDLLLGDHFVGGNSSLAAIAGYPSITVPAGFIADLPVGVSFTGRAWSEPVLIEIAFSYEQASGHRRAPAFKPTD